ALFDENWLEKMLTQGKINIRYERFEGGSLLTATTDELQQMLIEHAEDPGMFPEPVQLHRKQNDTESSSTEKESAKEQSPTTPPSEPELPFEFHVNFWINLHHFL